MPRAIRNARARAMQGQRAGFVTRVLAVAIDVGIVFLLYTATLYAYAVIHYLLTSKPLTLPTPDTWVRNLVAAGVAFAYLVSAWASTGRTLGAQVLGLAVVTDRGGPLSPLRAASRAIVCLLIAIPSLLWILVSKKNAALHDLICGTAVVYDWRGHALHMAETAER
jgi:uncharacterized RDD family membrane protein YckC